MSRFVETYLCTMEEKALENLKIDCLERANNSDSPTFVDSQKRLAERCQEELDRRKVTV